MRNLHYEKFADGTVKCIEDEIPFDVPETWEWCRLRELFTVCSSKRVLQSEWRNSGVPFYRAREIVKLSDNGFVDNELFITVEHYHRLEKEYGVPQVGDLMVSGVGTIGKVYIVQNDDKFYYKDASVLCFQNRTGFVHPLFARFLLESSLMQSQMHDHSNGTTVDTITISTAMNYLCLIPPLEEQERIASSICTLIERVDIIADSCDSIRDLIAKAKEKVLDLAIRGQLVPQNPDDEPASVLLDRIRAEKEELIKQGKIKRDKRDSVIFRGEDNSYYEKVRNECICIDDDLPYDIPVNWAWCELQDCCYKEIKRGRSPKYADTGKVLSFAQKCNQKSGSINISLAQWIDDSSIDRYDEDEYMLDGDIVINSTGTGTLGRVGIYHDSDNHARTPIVPDSHVTIVRTSSLINSSYIFLCLKAMQSNLEELGEGSTNQKELKPLTIQQQRIPVPPLAEQHAIVKRVYAFFEELECVEANLR